MSRRIFLTGADFYCPGNTGDQPIAALIEDGRITRYFQSYFGSPSDDLEFINLEKKYGKRGLIVPGGIDSHNHNTYAHFMNAVDLTGVTTQSEALELISNGVSGAGDGFVLVVNYNSVHAETLELSRSVLDSVSKDVGIVVFDKSFHRALLNTKAQQHYKFVQDGFGYKDLDGWVCGTWAFEVFMQIPFDDEKLLEALARYHQGFFELGITSFRDMYLPNLEFYGVLNQGYKDGVLKMPCEVFAPYPLFRDGFRPFIQGNLFGSGLKLIADGAFGARTALLSRPYEDVPSCGLNLLSEDAAERIKRALAAGFQKLAVHCIGDQAIQNTLDLVGGFVGDVRVFLEHFEMPSSKHIEKAMQLGIIPSMQPNFCTDSDPGVGYGDRLGKRIDSLNPLKLVYTLMGDRLILGSDGMPTGLLHGLKCALFPTVHGADITPHSALTCYTINGAKAMGITGQRGGLQVGQFFDAVLLSENIVGDRQKVHDAEILATFFEGNLVYSSVE